MSTEESNTNELVTQELLLESEIDNYLDEIVGLAEKRVKDAKLGGIRDFMGQLRNAAAVIASTSTSLEMFRNWMRYQASRKSSTWPPTLPKEISDDCEILGTWASEICNKIWKDTIGPNQLKQAKIRLIRLYLGYMIRSFTYEANKEVKQAGQSVPAERGGA